MFCLFVLIYQAHSFHTTLWFQLEDTVLLISTFLLFDHCGASLLSSDRAPLLFYDLMRAFSESLLLLLYSLHRRKPSYCNGIHSCLRQHREK